MFMNSGQGHQQSDLTGRAASTEPGTQVTSLLFATSPPQTQVIVAAPSCRYFFLSSYFL